jgi:hypothetical protein
MEWCNCRQPGRAASRDPLCLEAIGRALDWRCQPAEWRERPLLDRESVFGRRRSFSSTDIGRQTFWLGSPGAGGSHRGFSGREFVQIGGGPISPPLASWELVRFLKRWPHRIGAVLGNRPGNPELLHLVDQGCALQAQFRGSAFRSADHPTDSFKRA